jgi:hypothetical protein
MSASNVVTTLSGISVPNQIKSLAMYSQGALPVYLFIGDSAGALYIYDMSYGTQNRFSISGITVNTPITGLAVTEQYLFANTPGNCYQIPLYQFYGTTSNVINSLSAVSVANCYTRDDTNRGGIAVTPGGETLFIVTGNSRNVVTKVSISDTGNGSAKTFATFAPYLGPELSGIGLDSVGKTLYVTDIRTRRIFRCGYTDRNAQISNIYYQIATNDIPYEIEYSTFAGTLAFSTVNLTGQSSLQTYNPETAFYYNLIPLDSPIQLRQSYAMTYDSIGGIYVSTVSGNTAYTVIQNSYVYTPRPQPSVAPPKQIPVECGLILPGSCKQVWHPFNPRERFSLGSPYKPYQIIDPSAKISCPPSFVSDACPGFSERPPPPPPNPVVVRQQVVRPPISSASTQQISRSRNLASTRITGLNLVRSVDIPYLNDIQAPPVIGPDGSVYVSTMDGIVFRSTKDSALTSNTFPYTFSTAPAISLTDGQLAFGTAEGTLLVTDASLNQVWSIAGGATRTPSYVGGNIFVANGASLVARAGSNGSVVWSAPELPYPDTYASSPNVQLGNVLVGTTNGVLYVYDQYTGSNIFYVPIGTGAIRGSPNIDINNFVNVGSGSNLFQINMDRTLSSSTDTVFSSVNGNIVTPVVVAVDLSAKVRTFFTTDTGYSYSVDTESYLYQNASGVESNCIPVLDISSMYVVKPGSVNKYTWNMWANPTTSTALVQTATYAPANTAFVGSSTLVNDSNQLVVLARNLNQSIVEWSYSAPSGDQFGAFSLINGYLYFGGNSVNFYVKLANGTGVTSNYPLTYSSIASTSVLDGSNVYFTNDLAFYSIVQGGTESPINIYGITLPLGPPSKDGSNIVFANSEGALFSYTRTDDIVYLVGFSSGTSTLTPITVARPGVYIFTDDQSTVFLKDAFTTTVTETSITVNPSSPRLLTSPAYVGNSTYIVGSADSNIYWVQATQTPDWSLTVLGSNATAGGINQSIAVQDGLAFVCTTATAIYAFDTATRTQKWLNNQTPIATCPPVVYNDSVYIGTANGIYILNAETGELRTKIVLTGVKYVVVDSATGDVYATRIPQSSTVGEILKINPFPYSIRTLA